MDFFLKAVGFILSGLILANSAMAGDLHKAVRNGDIEQVRALVAEGLNVAELDKAVGAPLHWAAARGHQEVAVFLLESGADVNQKALPPDNLTPLHFAATSGHPALAAVLVDAGADLEAGAGSTGTPLHLAAQSNNIEVVDYLLDAGADINAKAKDGPYASSPLDYAAQAGAADAITLLLKNGYPINTANEATGITALHLAVFNAQADAVRVLIGAGADPRAESSKLETPFDLSQDNTEMKDLFAELGIK
ncbi:MAG: ankyrin repeat domain-containing protein [Pseudomonadota bacterium]